MITLFNRMMYGTKLIQNSFLTPLASAKRRWKVKQSFRLKIGGA